MDDDVVEPTPVWCIVANVIAEPWVDADGIHRHGTKHFTPNTKVYCLPAEWGDGYQKIPVLGRHRGTPRIEKMVISRQRLTNWRVKLVYNPHILRKISRSWQHADAISTVAWLCFEEEAYRANATGIGTVSPPDALLYSAYFGLSQEIKQALDRGADSNMRATIGWTPLMLAVCSRKIDAVRVLLEYGADCEAQTLDGISALSLARTSISRDRAMVIHLLETFV